MFKQFEPANIKELALVTSSAIDMAIVELSSGQSEMCLDTLRSLHGLLLDVAGLNPCAKVEVN